MLAQAQNKVKVTNERRAFEVWLSHGKNFASTARALGMPSSATQLRTWAQQHQWESRAAKRQQTALATVSARDEEIEGLRVVDTLEEHFDVGAQLIAKGAAYLMENGVDNSRDAIAAIKIGVDIQRRNMELPDHIISVVKGSDQELLLRAQQLIETIAEAANELTTATEEIDTITIDAATGSITTGSDGSYGIGSNRSPRRSSSGIGDDSGGAKTKRNRPTVAPPSG